MRLTLKLQDVEERNKYFNIISFSGGKDSTALLLRLLEEGVRLDGILYCDTGVEYPENYRHIDKVEKYIGQPITRLGGSYEESFEYLMTKKPKTGGRSKFPEELGYGWPGNRNRWCTNVMKAQRVDAWKKEKVEKLGIDPANIRHYIGIAANETRRCQEGFEYPLVTWGMTEDDCLQYCIDRGFDWEGFYNTFARLSCWACPLQRIGEFRLVREHYPEFWQKMLDMDKNLDMRFRNRNFLTQYNRVQDLEDRFAREDAEKIENERRAKLGLPPVKPSRKTVKKTPKKES